MNLRSACPWHIHNSPLAAQGARFGGGKGGGGGTTYQQQTTTIPPDVLARYNSVNAQAQQAAQQPFQTYTGQFVAPINPVQQQAIGNIGDISNAYGPYYGGATASTLAGAAAGAPYFGAAGQNIAQAQAGAAPYQQLATQFGLAGTQAVNPQALQTGQYMSPYIQSVVNPTMASLYQQQQQQQSQLAGNLALQGAFGGDRGAIQQANLAQQQGLAAAQTEGNLYNQAYNNALAAAQQQQGVNLGAQQANRAALQQFAPQALGIGQQGFAQGLGTAQAQQGLGAGIIGAGTNVGQALAGYGQGLTQTGLAANQALLAGGTLGQQTQQALNTALYNQFLQQQGYPFQVAQFLANIAEGTGALSGSTTTGTTTAPGSWLSDERAKENIVEVGRTHDDQPIYKFNYKGEPRKQIGLIAQDVEQDHPDAVGLAGGLKTVNYDKATKDAEVHRAEGGLVPESMGGVVAPSFERQAFADAGAAMPQYNMYDPIIQQILQQRMQAGLAGGSPYTVGGSRVPAGAMQSSPQRQVLRGSLPTLPKPQNVNPVTETASTIKGAGTIGEAGEKLYDWAKGKIGGTDTTPPSPQNRTIEEQQTSATGPAAGSTSGAPNMTPVDPSDPLYGLRHGGRIHRDDGGDVLPYGTDSSGYVPTGETKSPSQLESEQKSMVAGLGGAGGGGGGSGGGGGGLIGGIKDAASLVGAGTTLAKGAGWLMNLLPALAAAHGGRIHRQEGGGVLDRAKNAIGHIESSNNYKALGPLTGGDRAYGRYQVMGANIPSWTEEALGRRLTPQEFLNSPEAQDRVFEHHFGKAIQQHGNIDDAASVWFSGRPLKQAGSSRDVLGTTVPAYIRRFHEAMGGEETPVVSRGLAPVTDVTDLNERPKGLVAALGSPDSYLQNLRDMQTEERTRREAGLARGGRAHYQDGGADNIDLPTNKYLPDYFAPGVSERAEERRQVRTSPFELYGSTEKYLPKVEAAPPTPTATASASLPEMPRMPGLGGFNLYEDRLPPPATLDEHAYENMRQEKALLSAQRAGTPYPESGTEIVPPPSSRTYTPYPESGTQIVTPGLAPLPSKTISAAPGMRGPDTGVVPPSNGPTETAQIQNVRKEEKPTEQRGFFGEVGDSLRGLGDWFGRNKDWLVPAAGFLAGSAQAPSFALGLAPGFKTALGAYTGLTQLDTERLRASSAAVSPLITNLTILQSRIAAQRAALMGKPPSPELLAMERQASALQDQIARLSGNISSYLGPARAGIEPTTGAGAGAAGAAAPAVTPAVAAEPTAPTPVSAPPATTPAAPTPEPQQAQAPAPQQPAAPQAPQAPPLPVTTAALKADPSLFNNIRDEQNPIKIIEQANAMAPFTDPAKVLERYNAAAAIERQWAETGRYLDKDGINRMVPGWLENKMQELRGTKNVEYFGKKAEMAVARNIALANVDEIQKALELYQSGYFNDYLGSANKIMSALGYAPLTNAQDPAEHERFLKSSYGLIFNQLGALGGQPMKVELENLKNTVPTNTLTPQGNKYLLTSIKAILNYENKLFTDEVAQAARNPAAFDPTMFYAAWNQRPENNISTMKQNIGRELAVRGVEPTSTDDVGKRFIVEPTKENKLTKPTPLYLLRFDRSPDGKSLIPIYGEKK
jgi:Chaperone of endosialidase